MLAEHLATAMTVAGKGANSDAECIFRHLRHNPHLYKAELHFVTCPENQISHPFYPLIIDVFGLFETQAMLTEDLRT